MFTKQQTFQAFSQAVAALARELGTDDVKVYRDCDSSYSAYVIATGTEPTFRLPVPYGLALSMTHGSDAVHVMLDYKHDAHTAETRLSSLETRSSDVVEPLCKFVGILPYVIQATV